MTGRTPKDAGKQEEEELQKAILANISAETMTITNELTGIATTFDLPLPVPPRETGDKKTASE